MLAEHGIAASEINSVVAGASTIVTNLIIERKGARTGLITTQGFRDIIEIRRELRYDMYDLSAGFPDPIVPRELRAELPERVDSNGEVLRAPREEEIEAIVTRLREAGVEAIAVVLLHSYRNPAHEQQVASVIRRIAPGLFTSISYDVLAELREYERTVATVLNAYVMPSVRDYLSRIEAGLCTIGIAAKLEIMQSNGGTISRESAERVPIRMLESGPAAGVLGAADAARRAGRKDVLALDMGGTTAKVSLVADAEPDITTELEVARIQRLKKGSGLPIRLPSVDLIEIGAGGGSIAFIDSTGLLKVGPRSAGAAPGPACYGLGGIEPTVTDAALVLGYLDPDRPLSGEVRLRRELAEQAIATRVARPLSLSVIAAACGIYRIVCEQMAAACKVHAVEKGKDLRRFALLAFGGAGPMHARNVALGARCSEILVPANAGVFSAQGLLVAPLKFDSVRTRYSRLDSIAWLDIEALFREMQEALRRELSASRAAIEFRRSADARYVGQGFEVTTDVPASLHASSGADVAERFHAAYARRFGNPLKDQPIEVLNWRLEALAHSLWPELRPTYDGKGRQSRSRSRQAYFPEVERFLEAEVLGEAELVGADWRYGPALVEQSGSTVVIGPDDKFRMDDLGNVRIVIAGSNAVRMDAA
jgi:N-methylhydantoinase A/oxoprolinase/acetone carboxylase beta subunit